MYTIAFGFEKSSWRVGLFLCLYGIVFWKFVTRNVRGVMEKAIGIYTCIISFMVWRAISRIEPNSDISNLFTSWNKLCSCAGRENKFCLLGYNHGKINKAQQANDGSLSNEAIFHFWVIISL